MDYKKVILIEPRFRLNNQDFNEKKTTLTIIKTHEDGWLVVFYGISRGGQYPYPFI